MTRIDRAVTVQRGRWWSPFLAGAAAGLLAGLVFGRTRAGDDGDEESEAWTRIRGAWNGAVEGAAGSLSAAREMMAGDPSGPLDPVLLEALLEDVPEASGCHPRVLADGIVEVVGSCPSEEALVPVLDALAAVPGVEVVVNRVWTPDSAGPAAPGDASPGRAGGSGGRTGHGEPH